MLIDLFSPKGTYDNVFLANYSYINLERPVDARTGDCQRDGFRRRPVLHALLGQA